MFLKDDERVAICKACRDCPMCNIIDEVALYCGRESNNPRGRAMMLWGIETGRLSWEDEGVADVLYKSLLDGLPLEWCAGNYDLDELVIWGRSKLVEKDLAPRTVRLVSEAVKGSGNPFSDGNGNTSEIVEQGGGFVGGEPEVLLYFGSTARIKRPQAAVSLVRILRKAGIPFEVLGDECDSGFLLYQLGDFDSMVAQAKRVCGMVENLRAKKLVTLSASAYRMFTTRYPRFGMQLPGGMEVLHVSEYLAGLVKEGRLSIKKQNGKSVTYHDPACLVRYIDVTGPPRALLEVRFGTQLVEMEHNRSMAGPAGETGGLSFTYPEIAGAVAKKRVQEAKRTGAEIIASSDPFCEEMLCGPAKEEGVEVKDIVELVDSAV